MMWLKLFLCIIGLNFGESEIVKRACQDTIPNCSEYTTGICSDPLYSQWVKDKCANFCNKCNAPTTPPVPVIPSVISATDCVDKLTNCHEYGRSVCTDMNYEQWVTANCAKFCLKCISGAATLKPTTTDGVCRDTISNCDGYTQSVCHDTQYDDWVLKHCAVYCHRCESSTTPKPATVSSLETCHDVLTNCQDYGSGVCTDPLYSSWALQNCAQTCKKCGGNGTSNAVCEDNVSNCAELHQRVQICTDPNSRIYVDQNCRLTCGICKGGSNVPDNCRDGLTNCKDYGASICTDTNYYQWVKQNCPKTCNMCPVATTIPIATIGTSLGCVYVGQTYREGETWKDGCKYLCSCEDDVTGKYVCDEMCLSWNLPTQCHMAPAAPGKCCATPVCPDGFTINYPPGYVEH